MKVRYRRTDRGDYEVWDAVRSRICVVSKREKRYNIAPRPFTVTYWVAMGVVGFPSVNDQAMDYERRVDVVAAVLAHLGRTDLTP